LDLVFEIGVRDAKSQAGPLNVNTKTYEGMLWGRYNIARTQSWVFFTALGSGAYQTNVKTRWNLQERKNKGQAYWQLASLVGAGGQIFEKISGDAQARLYFPFPEKTAQLRFVFSLSYSL